MNTTTPIPQTGLFRFRAMGTEFEVHTYPDDGGEAGIRVRAQVEAWEARFSRFRPDSELSALNQDGARWTAVSADMFDVVSQALAWRRRTNGIFEPGILQALVASGYSATFDSLPKLQSWSQPSVTLPGFPTVDLDPISRRVRLQDGAQLDLGGIVKGWAVDRLIGEVAGNGIVNAGGDLRAAGSAEQGFGWVVGVEDVRYCHRDAFLIALRDEAIATSGTNRRAWLAGGARAHHLIDPRTRRPAETDVATATVLAPTCVEAEVAAKVALILGSGEGLVYLEAAALAGVLVRDDGSWTATAAMKGRFL